MMNLKPVDMGVALPKIVDMSHPSLIPQANQRINAEQDQLAMNQQKLDEKNMHRSTEVESATGETIRGDQEGQSKNQNRNSKRKKANQDPAAQQQNAVVQDPYKGKHIDFKA